MSFQLTPESVTLKQQTQELTHTKQAIAQLGGYTAIVGAISMFIGAALWGLSGTDLWTALSTGDLANYLISVGAAKTVLVANTSFWIAGVLLMGVAGKMMAKLSQRRPAWAQVGLVCLQTAVPLAIVSFITMLSLAVQIGADSSATAVAIAEVIGWIGARADDLATLLIVGVAPLFISLAGRDDWVPTWLLRFSYLAGFAGLLSVMAIYNPALASLGFVIIPFGLGWMIAAGVVMVRQAK